MDFGDILKEWDDETAKAAGKKAVREAERRLARERGTEASGAESIAAGGAAPERKVRAAEPRVDPLTAWLRIHGVQDKDAEARSADEAGQGDSRSAAEKRRRLRSMAPEAAIDLHGLSRDESWLRLQAFFADARKRGLEKVLVVHGKGNHSEGESILARTTRDFLERCPFAGERGHADAKSGGTGATWVVLKRGPAREPGGEA